MSTTATLDLGSLIEERQEGNLRLREKHIDPECAKALRTIKFDRKNVQAEAPCLGDSDDQRALDSLSACGVFTVGRNHPVIRTTLEDFLRATRCSLVQMAAPRLFGCLADEFEKPVPSSLGALFLKNSGTEGSETAVQLKRRATRWTIFSIKLESSKSERSMDHGQNESQRLCCLCFHN